MAHNIEYYTYPENVNKKRVEAELNNYVQKCTWEEGGGGLHSPIRWLNHICDNYDDAQSYIRSQDKGWYDQLAVLYKEPIKGKGRTKKHLNIQERLRKEHEKLKEYTIKHSVRNFKAEHVGCPNCGSKLKRTLLSGERCVLCNTDLRGKTTLDTISKYEENIKNLTKELNAEEQKYTDKANTLCWCVKIEYHT